MNNGQTQTPQGQSTQSFGFTEGVGLESNGANPTGDSINTDGFFQDPAEIAKQQATLGGTALNSPDQTEAINQPESQAPIAAPEVTMPLPGAFTEATVPPVGTPELGQVIEVNQPPEPPQLTTSKSSQHAAEATETTKETDDVMNKSIIKAFADGEVNGREDLSVIKKIEELDPAAMADQWRDACGIANEEKEA